eukprot:TRINITY_DN44221_c0_g2_i1.p1 TRINITY_DN44221_c0_g2~~TRINITY_DN44221_c0_g2_i1.p1  ORF type:complete len:206 (-),score=46.84 TRINITY_DN44221_c0_g2_i1:10-627(-)
MKSVWSTPTTPTTTVANNIPSEVAVVVLFTDKPKTSALFKSLAVKYSGMVRFVEVVVKGSTSPVAKHDVFAGADTTPFPALFVITPSEDGSFVSSKYPVDNALTVGAISSHIDQVAGLTLEEVGTHIQKKNAITTRAHQRRSGIVSGVIEVNSKACLLYTSDAADEEDSVDLGGRRIIKKKNSKKLQDKRERIKKIRNEYRHDKR